MDIFIMIDISGSMIGHKISAVTDALDNMKEALVDYSYDNGPVRICTELFSREVQWSPEHLVSIDKFQWEEPICTGMTSLGKACSSLANVLQNTICSDSIKIILISDGCPTDDYDEGLRDLHNLMIFKDSDRYAIGLGEDADVAALSDFTDDANKVYRITELDKLLDCLTNAVMQDISNADESEVLPSYSHNTESNDWE